MGRRKYEIMINDKILGERASVDYILCSGSFSNKAASLNSLQLQHAGTCNEVA